MDREYLEKNYPRILSAIEEDIDELRYLLVIDENDDDVDNDEFDVFEPEEYNYMVYVTERLQKAMGEELFSQLPAILEESSSFVRFFASEEDLYGVWLDDDEYAVAKAILDEIEKRMEAS